MGWGGQLGGQLATVWHRKEETVKYAVLACGSKGQLDRELEHTMATRDSYEGEQTDQGSCKNMASGSKTIPQCISMSVPTFKTGSLIEEERLPTTPHNLESLTVE